MRRRARVVGLAPTNAVAQDMKEDGFARARTVHAELFRAEERPHGVGPPHRGHGRRGGDGGQPNVTGELLARPELAGAKVVLAGDDRQLASIERGGLFSELRKAARLGRNHRGDAPACRLAARGGARSGGGPVR